MVVYIPERKNWTCTFYTFLFRSINAEYKRESGSQEIDADSSQWRLKRRSNGNGCAHCHTRMDPFSFTYSHTFVQIGESEETKSTIRKRTWVMFTSRIIQFSEYLRATMETRGAWKMWTNRKRESKVQTCTRMYMILYFHFMYWSVFVVQYIYFVE